MSLPDGYGFVFSNGPETARRLLAAADSVDVPQETVRSVQDGYEVPKEVLDAYNDTEDREFPAPTEGVFSLEAPQTSHEPFVPDTSHEAAEITEDSDEAEEIKDEGDGAEEAKPAGNAGKDAWADWAAEYKGYDKSEDLSRDELKAKYAV